MTTSVNSPKHPRIRTHRWAQLALLCSLTWAASTIHAQSPVSPTSPSPTSTTPTSPSAASNNLALPQLGDGSELTFGSERRIGDRIANELYKDTDYIDDPVITECVQNIWQSLIAASRLRSELTPEMEAAYAWQVIMSKERTVNAFALPGGYFGLYMGTVGIVTSPDELASVLGHELSHVTQRHIARSMDNQSAQMPLLLGAMVLGVLAASKSPDAAGAMIIGGQAGAIQKQLNFSRDMEREADRIGFTVATQAGYEGRGFVAMFEKLQQSNRWNDFGNFPYLRSHPLTTERIADMQGRIANANGGLANNGNSASAPAATTLSAIEQMRLDFPMIAARARVISGSGVDALRNWGEQIQPDHFSKLSDSERLGALYGATFAAIQLRDFAQAQTNLAALVELTKARPHSLRIAQLLGAELALAQNKPLQARQALAGVSPTSGRATVLMFAKIDTLAGDAAQAAQNLQIWLADHPTDAQAWLQLSAADMVIGRRVAAVRAEAEAYLAQQDLSGALTRFKAAQEIARSKGTSNAESIEASIADTRIHELELRIKEDMRTR